MGVLSRIRDTEEGGRVEVESRSISYQHPGASGGASKGASGGESSSISYQHPGASGGASQGASGGESSSISYQHPGASSPANNPHEEEGVKQGDEAVKQTAIPGKVSGPKTPIGEPSSRVPMHVSETVYKVTLCLCMHAYTSGLKPQQKQWRRSHHPPP